MQTSITTWNRVCVSTSWLHYFCSSCYNIASLHQCLLSGDVTHRLSSLNWYKLNEFSAWYIYKNYIVFFIFIFQDRGKIDCSSVCMCHPLYKKIISFNTFQSLTQCRTINYYVLRNLNNNAKKVTCKKTQSRWSILTLNLKNMIIK